MTQEQTNLVAMLMDDAELRREFAADPDAVLTRLGLQVDEETRAALTSIEWSDQNVQLLERVSKSCMYTASDVRLKTNVRPL
jgi:hypothetical protein